MFNNICPHPLLIVRRETRSSKQDKTALPANQRAAWDLLGPLQARLEEQYSNTGSTEPELHVPPELQDMYRLDLFGNVIAREAGNCCVCASNVDHIFPG